MAKTWTMEYDPGRRAGSALRADVGRTYAIAPGSRWRRVLACLRAPGVQAMAVIRFGQWALGQPVWMRWLFDPVYGLLSVYVRVVWGIEMSRRSRIGAGLYIAHFGGITIAPEAVIGRNCNISQSITIGWGGQGEQAGVPVIGDDVYIAPGARLFGRIRVGNNVKIGANAVVYKDIPDNAIVVLDPGFRILNYRGNRRAAAATEPRDTGTVSSV